MQLSLQNFSTAVEAMAAAVQGAATQLLDLTVGSVLRAVLEANASVVLWLQWLIVQVLAATRLATSTGSDCDSFGADFGFTRLSAVAAIGQVTFARFTPSAGAFVPVGTTVSTLDNTQHFLVTADFTNAAFGAAANGYMLGANVATLTVPVVAANAGMAANMQAGAVAMLSTALPGIDTVTNAAAMTGGIDAESDGAFRSRFSNYLASLSRATDLAIGAAILGIQQGLSYQIAENVDQSGATQLGHLVVTVNDGSGNPPASLLSLVQQAVDAVRPVGTSFAVQGPAVALANVSMILTTVAGTSHQAAVAAAASAVEAFIGSLGIGAPLNYTRLAQLAYAASSAIINVSDVFLNGATTDLVPPAFGVVQVGTVAVS